MNRRELAAAALLLCAPQPVWPAAERQRGREPSIPTLLRVMVSPARGGLWARVPVIDTDPNRGPTYGIMPVLVRLSSNTLRSIHAPMVSYNQNFGLTGRYQYFLFPSKTDVFQARASLSQRVDREVVADWSTRSLLGSTIGLDLRAETARSGSRRFYGRGPRSSPDSEANYALDTINYRVSAALPMRRGSRWQLKLEHDEQLNRVMDGPIERIRDLREVHPLEYEATRRRKSDGTVRVGFAYDARDSAETTSSGILAETFVEGAAGATLSDFRYVRGGVDMRRFKPWRFQAGEPRMVTAAHARLEQLDGTAPFWSLPSLGGKYSHRAYGEGRWVDRGLASASLEHRMRVAKLPVAHMPTSFWLDPFFTVGEVFPDPARFESRYLRPGYGFAFRAVARPHLVASADFGFGQEGMTVFLDINYAF